MPPAVHVGVSIRHVPRAMPTEVHVPCACACLAAGQGASPCTAKSVMLTVDGQPTDGLRKGEEYLKASDKPETRVEIHLPNVPRQYELGAIVSGK